MLQRFKQLSTHLFALSRPLSIDATSLKKLWIKSWVQSWHLTSCSLFQTFTLAIRVPDKIHAWFNTLIQTVKFVCFKASLIKLFILFVSQVHIVKLSFLHFQFFCFPGVFLSSGGTEPEILDFHLCFFLLQFPCQFLHLIAKLILFKFVFTFVWFITLTEFLLICPLFWSEDYFLFAFTSLDEDFYNHLAATSFFFSMLHTFMQQSSRDILTYCSLHSVDCASFLYFPLTNARSK